MGEEEKAPFPGGKNPNPREVLNLAFSLLGWRLPHFPILLHTNTSNSCHLGASTPVALLAWGALCPHPGPSFHSPTPSRSSLTSSSLKPFYSCHPHLPPTRGGLSLQPMYCPSHYGHSVSSVTLIRQLNISELKFLPPREKHVVEMR